MPISSFPRRRFLQGAMAATVLHTSRSLARGAMPATPPSSSWVLLGTGSGEGIYRARWNGTTGELGAPELAAAAPKPSFLTLHPHLPVVYCCNEGEGDEGAVSAFTLDRAQAMLMPLGRQLSHGSAPCFVSTDASGRLLFAANYTGGSLAAFALDAQGKPAPAARVFACAGNAACGTPGPVRDRQDGPHLHCATLSPDNHFVLACDLGDDSILVFPIKPGTAQPLGDPLRVPNEAGSGPRHLAFHPNGRWLYCIHELNCTVTQFTWHTKGTHPQVQAVPGSSVSVLSPGAPAQAPNTAAEIAISRDGRFLYASTRGLDLLTVFRVDGQGHLTQVQQLPCGGKTPRFFALDPTGQWLVCAHQDGNTIATFARNAQTGQLTPKSTQTAQNPQCVLWL